MIVWVRNIVLIVFVLTAIYLALSTVSRLRQRRKLLTDYTAEHAATPKEEFIAKGMQKYERSKGMQKYERSLKPKLFVGVYLFPLVVITLLIYLAQT